MYAVPVLAALTPVLERVGGHLRAVVHPQVFRGAALGDQPLQLAHGLIGVDAALHQHHQRFAGELVDDVEQLDRPPVGGLVELVIRDLG